MDEQQFRRPSLKDVIRSFRHKNVAYTTGAKDSVLVRQTNKMQSWLDTFKYEAFQWDLFVW